VTDELVAKVDEKIRENRRFTITELSINFPQVSRTLLFEIVTQKLGQAAEFYDGGISKLAQRYDKCLNLFGDYVEK